MKQLTVQIPDAKYHFFMELIRSLNFVATVEDQTNTDEQEVMTKHQILEDFKGALQEVKLIKAGKKKAISLEDLINEL